MGRKPIRARSSGRVGRKRGAAVAGAVAGSFLRVVRRAVIRNAIAGVKVQRAAMKRGFSPEQARQIAHSVMQKNLKQAIKEAGAYEAGRIARSAIKTARQRYEASHNLTPRSRAALRVVAGAAALGTRRSTRTLVRLARDPATRRYARIAARMAAEAYRQRYGRNMPIAISPRTIEGTFRYD